MIGPTAPTPAAVLNEVMFWLDRQGYAVSWDGNREAFEAAGALLANLDISLRLAGR
jgi:hypothetical protein